MSDRGYVTPGEAGLIVFLGLMALFVIALLISAGKKADDQHIDREHNMCVIRVTVSCGDNDICRYRTSVPCADLDTLPNASKGDK